MLNTIIIVLEGIPSIVRRIDVDTLHFPFIFWEESLEGKEIIPMDEHILARGISIGFLWILDEDTRLDICDIVIWMILSDPGEFEALSGHDQ
jgi:hypothetical protein